MSTNGDWPRIFGDAGNWPRISDMTSKKKKEVEVILTEYHKAGDVLCVSDDGSYKWKPNLLTVYMGTQKDGHVFELSGISRKRVQEQWKTKKHHGVARVFIGNDDFTGHPAHCDAWQMDKIVRLLTGLDYDELEKFGGYEVVDLLDEEVHMKVTFTDDEDTEDSDCRD